MKVDLETIKEIVDRIDDVYREAIEDHSENYEEAHQYWTEQMRECGLEGQDLDEAVQEAKEWAEHEESLQRIFSGHR